MGPHAHVHVLLQVVTVVTVRAGGLQNSVEFAYCYEDVMRQYQDSLQRLGVGRVECVVIHDMEEAEGQIPLHARGTRSHLAGERAGGTGRGGYAALEELRSSGQIKAFGAGINIWTGDHNHTEESYRQFNIDYLDFLLSLPAEGERPLDFVLLAGGSGTHIPHTTGTLFAACALYLWVCCEHVHSCWPWDCDRHLHLAQPKCLGGWHSGQVSRDEHRGCSGRGFQ